MSNKEYAANAMCNSGGRLKRQKRQDYIQNFNGDNRHAGVDHFYPQPANGPNRALVKGDPRGLGFADGHGCVNFKKNTMKPLDPYEQYSPEYENRHEVETPVLEESEEKLNYDQAFEDMKFQIDRRNYTKAKYRNNIENGSESHDDSDNIYDNYLDNNINSDYMDSKQRSHSIDELDHNDILFKKTDNSDIANEVDDEYGTNRGISIPNPQKNMRKEDFDLNPEENTSPLKLPNNPGSSTNTITKAVTHLRSVESSESITQSPNCVLKTYVINKSRKLISRLNQSEKDCNYCNKSKCYRNDEMLLSQINKNLSKKYMTSKDFYNVKIVNDIIYNENTHIVSVFKDYLILDDISEFLKRSYAAIETKPRLIKIYEFYDKYSKVFPNYVVLPESKYMFKNIERKQRMIDEKQKYKNEQEKRLKNRVERKSNNGGFSDLLDSSESIEKIFNTKFVESILKAKPESVMNSSGGYSNMSRFSQLEEHKIQSSTISQNSQIHKHSPSSLMHEICNQSGIKLHHKDLPLEAIISEFLENDSEILTNNSIDN